ncbi:hypothetical protein PR001_g14602 [Phytophthora rubi]|uniref:Uncharacterized protein n=2 Tax=Phytophthora rubi TaxID=129364 RepID=A0A6A3LAZ7_9STRA|nr:hypothetical protein PR001_g14602 [Phytophthora rubi]
MRCSHDHSLILVCDEEVHGFTLIVEIETLFSSETRQTVPTLTAPGDPGCQKPLKYTSEVPKNWDGKDWHQYKWAMWIVFKKKKLLDILNGDVVGSSLTSNETEEEFDDKQLTIMQLIGMSLSGYISHQVRDKDAGTAM